MKNWLDLGNWNALCDSCGRKFKASQLRRRWDGLMVCEEDYELRHPQDFLRVAKEQIAVPWARPYPAQDTYLPSCDLASSSGVASYAVAGCFHAGVAYTPTFWTLPSFCTIGSSQPLADVAGAGCAIVQF